MTREEAIQALELMKSEESYNALIDLCNIAIESLSADALLTQEIDFHKKVSRIEAEKVVDLEHKLADMVSVVRCKDCKYYSVEGKTTQFGWCNALEMPTDPDGYCYLGERKEE